ncbi:MAG: cyclic nucleotide-binding domain-containing protein [Candidatus Sericytochromatia bacterium]|nr:cyclic nucleotide-binding domain-containing protein [Candidatus Sericytochromatia bacterium]
MIDDIAVIAMPMRFGDGECVFLEKESETALFLIAEGSIRITKQDSSRRSREITVIPAGSVCGEMSLLAGMARSCSGYAVNDVMVYKITRVAFYDLLNRDNAAAHKMLLGLCELMGGRMRIMDEQMVQLLDRQDAETHQPEMADLRDKLFNEWAF